MPAPSRTFGSSRSAAKERSSRQPKNRRGERGDPQDYREKREKGSRKRDERLTGGGGRRQKEVRAENVRKWLAAGSLDRDVGDIAATVDRLVSALDTRDWMASENAPSDSDSRHRGDPRDRESHEDLTFREEADFGEVARRIADFRRSRPDPIEEDEATLRYRRPRSEAPRRATRRTYASDEEPAAHEPSRPNGWNVNWRDYLEEERARTEPPEPAQPEPSAGSWDAPGAGRSQAPDTLLQNRLAALRARASGTARTERSEMTETFAAAPMPHTAAPSFPQPQPVAEPAPMPQSYAHPQAATENLAPAVAFAKALLAGADPSGWQAQAAAAPAPAPVAPAPAPVAPPAPVQTAAPAPQAPPPDAAEEDDEPTVPHDYAAWAALAVLQKEQEQAREERTASAESASRAEKLAGATAARIKQLAARLDQIQEIDFAARFDSIEQRLGERVAEPVDLAPISGQLDAMGDRFDRIEARFEEQAAAPPPAVDLTPLTDHLRAIEVRIAEIERTAAERHDTLCMLIADIAEQIESVPDPSERLETLELDVDTLVRHIEAHETNLRSLTVLADAVDRLETRLSDRSQPQPRPGFAEPAQPSHVSHSSGVRRIDPVPGPEDYLTSVSAAPAAHEPASSAAWSDAGHRWPRTGSQTPSSGEGATQGRAMSERDAILERYRRRAKAVGGAG